MARRRLLARLKSASKAQPVAIFNFLLLTIFQRLWPKIYGRTMRDQLAGEKKGSALRRGTLWGDWGTHLSSLLISCEIRVVVLEKCVQSIFLLRAIHFHCN